MRAACRRPLWTRLALWLAVPAGVLGALQVMACSLVPRQGQLVSRPPEAANAPWELPARATPTQRLYRVHYQGPEGHLSFKLSVYLETPRRFRLLAADILGRRLWTLAIEEDGRALWLNHRDKTFCRTEARRGLVFLPLTQLPLEAVPRLLLGRLPQQPFNDLRQAPGQVSFRDLRGREWSAVLDPAGAPQRWSLREGGEPVAWWQREPNGPGVLFSDRRGRQQVRWREIVQERLRVPVPPATVPTAYREALCTARTAP